MNNVEPNFGKKPKLLNPTNTDTTYFAEITSRKLKSIFLTEENQNPFACSLACFL